jgi:protoporphyrinogen IX oxidase
MEYPWLKAFHVAAVIGWIGGLLVSSLVMSMLVTSSLSLDSWARQAIERVREWDRKVTMPAMLLAWMLGIAMAVQAGWFSSRWLMIKLVLVVGLSALHGVQSGLLRRVADDLHHPIPVMLRFSAPVTLATMTAIAILAVTKPF